MKTLNLKIEACTKGCPYYRFNLVVRDSGVGYDNLHSCKLSSRAIVYDEKMSIANDPSRVIPKWCELQDMEQVDG